MFFADLNDYTAPAKNQAQYGYTVAFHDHETYSSTIPSGNSILAMFQYLRSEVRARQLFYHTANKDI